MPPPPLAFPFAQVNMGGSSGPPPFQPSDIPDLALLLDANLGTHVTAGHITQWDDQSGHGLNVLATGTIPYSAAGGPSGQAMVTGTGAGNFFSSVADLVPPGTPRTVFAVMKQASGGGTILCCRATAILVDFLYYGGSIYVAYDGSATLNTAAGAADTANHMLTFGYVSGSAVTFSIDGTPVAVSGPGLGADLGVTGGFGIFTDFVVGSTFVGNLSLLAVYARCPLTGPELAAFRAYVLDRYGV